VEKPSDSLVYQMSNKTSEFKLNHLWSTASDQPPVINWQWLTTSDQPTVTIVTQNSNDFQL